MSVSPDSIQLSQLQGSVNTAQSQQAYSSIQKVGNRNDWRVKLSLSPRSDYLYNAASPGILYPLRVTDGIIFPYTPSINMSYNAGYQDVELPHSNYKGFFYKDSYAGNLDLSCIFTAQDSAEANYVLAVIHFFKSVTRMFYGTDTNRGAPPPLVYLTGLGEYQFNYHTCVVQQFSYKLPDNVDYIRAGSSNQVGLNLSQQRSKVNTTPNSLFAGAQRLFNVFLPKGAMPSTARSIPTLGLDGPTYVPTKLELSITLIPMQSRSQISQQFNLKDFASGSLLKGGFW